MTVRGDSRRAAARNKRSVERVELVCLANSIKLGDYCVAGVDRATMEWVRPIGSGQHGAVTFQEQILEDDTLPRLLDVVSVPLGGFHPLPGQPENRALASGKWRRLERLTNESAIELLDELVTDEPLFGTVTKAVSTQAVQSGAVLSSLAIVRPREIAWCYQGGKNLYAEFDHAGASLSLKVTDPAFIREFRGDTPDTYTFDDDDDVTTYLTVSLPEEWKGAHWKLVAGVMRL